MIDSINIIKAMQNKIFDKINKAIPLTIPNIKSTISDDDVLDNRLLILWLSSKRWIRSPDWYLVKKDRGKWTILFIFSNTTDWLIFFSNIFIEFRRTYWNIICIIVMSKKDNTT